MSETVLKFPVFIYRSSFGVRVKYWEWNGRWHWQYYINDDHVRSGESRSLNGALYHARQSLKGSLLHRTSKLSGDDNGAKGGAA